MSDMTAPPTNSCVPNVLVQMLRLGDDGLLGDTPEVGSMPADGLLTAVEESYGFFVNDTKFGAETCGTLSSVVCSVDRKFSE